MSGRDVIGIAQTGTGKTAAFALPILHHLAANPRPPERKGCRVLVLSPTRELSGQILESFRAYGRHLRIRVALAIGGVPLGGQVRALHNGVDVLVATPGPAYRSGQEQCASPEWCRMSCARRSRPNARHGLHSRYPQNRCETSGRSGRRCCFRRLCPRRSPTSPSSYCATRSELPSRAVGSTVERVEQRIIHVDRGSQANRPRRRLAARADRSCADLHQNQARRRQGRARLDQGRRGRRRDPRQ